MCITSHREAINNYLHQSSDIVKKRVENTLKACQISAPNSIRRRRIRSADDATETDDVRIAAGERIRAKKHVDAPSGNWEGSGDRAEENATDPTSIGDDVDLTFADDSLEGSGSAVTPATMDTKAADDDDIDALVSFFLNDESVGDVTKDVLKDMLKFRRTFVTSSGVTTFCPLRRPRTD